MTSKLIQSGNNIHEKIEGENGSLQFKSSSNDGLDLFFKLVRGYDRIELEHCLTSDSPNDIAGLFNLAFQTRNCRGGKGERVLFHEMIITLYEHYPKTVMNVMSLVPLDYLHSSHTNSRTCWSNCGDDPKLWFKYAQYFC